MKRVVLVVAGVLLVGVMLSQIEVPAADEPEKTDADRTMALIDIMIDSISGAAELQGFGDVVEQLEKFRSDPERLKRVIEFMEENPPPECTCPELEEWEERFDKMMSVDDRELF